MGRKHRKKLPEFETAYYDDFEDELDDDFDDIGNLSKDFYSADWEDPSESEHRFSTRRKIERRNDLKDLYSQFDDWDDLDISKEW